MTNIEKIIFDSKYRVEYIDSSREFKVTFRASRYNYNSIIVDESYMYSVIENIIYFDAKEFHEYVKDTKER